MVQTFRWAEPSDYEALGELMFEAVRTGESQYSEDQRRAWVPAPRSGPEWNARLAAQDVILAEEEGEPLGFMSLGHAGYVDFAYIKPRAQHSGLFRHLLSEIEQRAASRGYPLLWVHASLMAQPAFAALGFCIRRSEEVELRGERFQRFLMEKRLPV